MDSRFNAERLIKAVEANDIEFVEQAFESGIDPLMFVTHPVTINNEHYQIPLLFLAKSDEMSVLFLSHAHKINNEIYNLEDLYKTVVPQIDQHSIGLFIRDLAYDHDSLPHIVTLLKYTPHVIDTSAINYALVSLILSSYKDEIDFNNPATIALIQASSDLKHPILHLQPIRITGVDADFVSKRMGSPFFIILDQYGHNLKENNDTSKDIEFIHLMLNNNHMLWDDVKHKNVGTTYPLNRTKNISPPWHGKINNPRLDYVKLGLNATYESVDNLAITKYLEALNIFQILMLAKQNGELDALPMDVINFIARTILPLVQPLPSVENINQILHTPLAKQKMLSNENVNLKEQVELFNIVYNILRQNEQSYKFATSAHTFPEDHKSLPPREYMKQAEKQAMTKEKGFTAKALEITKLDDHDARVKRLVDDQLSKKWLFTSSDEDIKKMRAEAEKKISAELKKGKSEPIKPTSNK